MPPSYVVGSSLTHQPTWCPLVHTHTCTPADAKWGRFIKVALSGSGQTLSHPDSLRVFDTLLPRARGGGLLASRLASHHVQFVGLFVHWIGLYHSSAPIDALLLHCRHDTVDIDTVGMTQ